MSDPVDLGQFIAELEQQRDDALGTLRLREGDVRYYKRQLQQAQERIAQLEARAYIAERRTNE